MEKSFTEKLKAGYLQGTEDENRKKPEGEKMTPKKQKKNLIILIVGVVCIFFLLKNITGGGKPSECDCRKVMLYEDGAVDAAKRILGGSYGAEFMGRSQRECALKYWDDIHNWQSSKGLNGTPKDNAMEYFMEKCN